MAVIGVGSVGLSALLAALVMAASCSPPPAGHAYTQTLWRWMQVGSFTPAIYFYLDALSLVMMLVVAFVSFLIHLYSAEFMDERRGLQPVLRLHESLRRLDADAGFWRTTCCCSTWAGKAWACAAICSLASGTRTPPMAVPPGRRSS